MIEKQPQQVPRKPSLRDLPVVKEAVRLARAKRALIAVVVGAALGLACQFAPPAYQLPCKVVARVLAALGGGV